VERVVTGISTATVLPADTVFLSSQSTAANDGIYAESSDWGELGIPGSLGKLRGIHGLGLVALL
jgi:hypothetical protein